MRRVMLLALLALALPTAVSARVMTYTTQNPVDDICPSDIANGCAPIVIHPWAGVIAGSFHHILVVAELVPLSGCPDHLLGTCSDVLTDTGVVQVSKPGPGLILFHDSVIAIVNKNGNSFTILADLQPKNGFHGHLTATYTLGRMPSPLSGGTIATPEPSTLGLLGTSLIGLAAMARRKLKLPT